MILDWTYHHQIPLCKFIFSNDIFYGVVPGFAIDCPCGVWCHGLTTFLLHCVHFLEIWSVSLTLRKTFFIAFIFLYIYIIYLNISYVINTYFYLPYFSISNSALFFSKYLWEYLSFSIDVVPPLSIGRYAEVEFHGNNFQMLFFRNYLGE